MDSSGLGEGLVAGYREYSNESSGSIKSRNLLKDC
jgi:hypothetical protein